MSWTYAHRIDANQPDIVRDLTRCGISVADTSVVGNDFPDLVCGAFGRTVLVEVKRPGKQLTDGQDAFRKAWRGGPVIRAERAEDVLAALKTST